jgi:DNA polymerase type B, organellar and viral
MSKTTTRSQGSQRRKTQSEDQRYARPTAAFVGVDGEGGDILGSHEYLLLRAGKHVLETGEPLTFAECAGFIADLPRGPIYVAYYFDYDVTMMIRRLPRDRIGRLLDRESRASDRPGMPMPVDYAGFQIDYLPHKEFRVRRRLPDVGGKRRYSKWIVISDVGSFFQSSFVSALRKWYGTMVDGVWVPNPGEAHMGEVIDKIHEGKLQRNSFGKVTEYEREYNLLEIKVLEMLMTKFRAMCDHANLHPTKWQGPGNLVMSQFRNVGMPRNRDLELDPDLVEFSNQAYYGGRFEPCRFGEISGPIYQYDINSAYARTYRDLPCLLHGSWARVSDMPAGGIFVGRVRFLHKPTSSLFCFPIRTKKGEIFFPRQGQGVYWSPEIQLAVEQGCQLEWVGGWAYQADCDCQHFDWVEDIYAERRRLGKDGTGYVLKIMLATIYGKLCQSVGAAPYANPIWAGLIVSTVRSQLARAALDTPTGAHGSDVIMLATDGLFCTLPRPYLAAGTELGEWELTVHDGMFVVQSGVYMLPDKLPKTRGVARRKVIQHTWDFYVAWQRYLRSSVSTGVDITLRSFVGIRSAYARNRLDIAGQWLYSRRRISFDWSTKRRLPRIVDSYVTTRPPEGNPELTSVPYKRTIGGTSFRDLDDEQPDWSDAL